MDEHTPSSAQDAQEKLALEAQVLSQVIAAMQQLQPDARARLLATVTTFFGLPRQHASTEPWPPSTTTSQMGFVDRAPFTEDRTQSPKEFLLEKRPQTDVDRAACLAYYLTHYRTTPHFKTIDISKLNTEAAQIKFSNAAAAVANTVRAGLLVAAGRGQVQLSAIGEQYVQALPDKDTARAAMKTARPRRRAKKSGTSSDGK